jgi:glycosyltransferase involved in cell wall biosynthesis
MNWLFVTSHFPWPMTHGTWLRVDHLAEQLIAAGEQVAVLSHEPDSAAAKAYRDLGVELATVPGRTGPRRGRPRRAFVPYAFDAPLANALAQRAAAQDVVVLAGRSALQYAPEARPARLVVADMVDDPIREEGPRLWDDFSPRVFIRRLLFLFGQRLAEKRFLPNVDLVTFVSLADEVGFYQRNPQQSTLVVGNGVDTAHFAPPADRRRAEPPTVVFLGNLGHEPNSDAALFLLREIIPLIQKTRPEVRGLIVGTDPPAVLQDLTGGGAEVTGWVEDVRPFLWQASVVLQPMRTGTGIKNKLLEAWAAGAPVVSTQLGMQGTPAQADRNILLGRTAQELADQALRIIDDPALGESLGQAGMQTVAQDMTWQAMAGTLLQAARAAQDTPEAGHGDS